MKRMHTVYWTAVEEGKFHISVWVSQRAQIFGGVANMSPIEPDHQSLCFFIMGQRKLSAVKQIGLLI